MLFQGSLVVNQPDALVISFPDFTPRIGIPVAFKDFVASTKVAPSQRTKFSRLLKLPKNHFLSNMTISCSKFLQYLKLDIVEVIFGEGVQHAHKDTHKHLHSYFIQNNGHLRCIKEPELILSLVSLKTYLNIHKINYRLIRYLIVHVRTLIKKCYLAQYVNVQQQQILLKNSTYI